MLTLKCMFIHRVNKVQNVPKDRKDLCSITTGKLLYLDKLSSVTLLRERGVLKEMPSCSLTSTFPVLETQNEPTFHQKKKTLFHHRKWSGLYRVGESQRRAGISRVQSGNQRTAISCFAKSPLVFIVVRAAKHQNYGLSIRPLHVTHSKALFIYYYSIY